MYRKTPKGRKEKFVSFMESRIMNALKNGASVISEQEDSNYKTVTFRMVTQNEFKLVTRDVIESIKEYYDLFLEDKIKH